MIDKRISRRIRQRREALGLTQEQLAEKVGLTPNYISTLERGVSFPRYDNLLRLLNGLETSADAIFCDVLTFSGDYMASSLSEALRALSPEDQHKILKMLELLTQSHSQLHSP